MKPLLTSKRFVSSSAKVGFFITFFLLFSSFAVLLFLNFSAQENAIPLASSKHFQAPLLSHPAGFYPDEIQLTITHPLAGSDIYYTTDGSAPGIHAEKYIAPIRITVNKSNNYLSEIPTSPRWKPPLKSFEKATIIRAVAVNAKGEKSMEVKRTYFVKKADSPDFSLPVISLVVDKEDFFDFKKGIYVLGKGYEDKDNYVKKNIKLSINWWDYPANYRKHGSDWERPVFMEYFDKNGNCAFSSDAGVRIHGSATRAYSQKSLRLFFRKDYGKNAIDYDIFGLSKDYIFSRILLRNGGNDWDRTLFRDVLMHDLLKSTNLDIQNFSTVIVFLNGEYWGIHHVREYFDENYFLHKYNIDPDHLSLADLNANDALQEFHLSKLFDFLKENNLSDDTAYAFISSQIDIQNFIDYTIAHIFFGNSDWPGNNLRLWRKITPAFKPEAPYGHDGRWRFLFFDTDYGFAYTRNPEAYQINMIEKSQSTDNFGLLFRSLLKNPSFKQEFISKFQVHLNTTFHIDTLLSRINYFEQVHAPEMENQISRWRKPESISDWKKNIQTLREFAMHRHKYQKEHLDQLKK
jgi:hypothetical protein